MKVDKNRPSMYFPKFKINLPRVDGKVFAITGTTSGTGFVAARTAAEKGGTVILLNRQSKRINAMMSKLREAVPKGDFVTIECDLQDFESVRRAADKIKASYTTLYCLAMNAGIAGAEDKATIDGCDAQMQTNHLSHFLLAQQLFPLLQEEANLNDDARIVTHSSGARDMTKKGFEQKYLEKKGGNLGGNGNSFLLMGGKMTRYAQTKLANSVFTYALHEKLQKSGSKVKSISCHPGGCATNLGDDMDINWFEKTFVLTPMLWFSMQSAEDGTMGLLRAMMDPDAESGKLYGPAKSGMTGLAVVNPPKPYENDPAAMEMLWETSEETCGVKFLV